MCFACEVSVYFVLGFLLEITLISFLYTHNKTKQINISIKIYFIAYIYKLETCYITLLIMIYRAGGKKSFSNAVN